MILVSFRGTNYNIPEPLSDAWSQDVTNYLVALSSGAVPFPTLADVDFGASFGIKALYYKSRAAIVAAAGVLRLAVTDAINWRNNANSADLSMLPNSNDMLTYSGVPISHKLAAPAYSALISIDASLADTFTITATNSTAFTINAPTNPQSGGVMLIRIRNTSGGALGAVTWNAVFKLAAWTSPATGNSRSIRFVYDGTNWVESGRDAADVPN